MRFLKKISKFSGTLKLKIDFIESLSLFCQRSHTYIKNQNRTFGSMCYIPPLIGLKLTKNTCDAIPLRLVIDLMTHFKNGHNLLKNKNINTSQYLVFYFRYSKF